MIYIESSANEFIKSSGLLSEEAASSMPQDARIYTISGIASALMKSISDSLKKVDFTKIDKSRGDIRQLELLSDFQNSANRLRDLYRSTDGDASYKSQQLLSIIIDSVKNLNKYSEDYKDAYRLKKTAMMLQYESVVASAIEALSYLISSTVDLTDGSDYVFAVDAEPKDIPYFDILRKYNSFAADDGMKKMAEGVDFIRRYYCEYPPESMISIYEAPDVVGMLSSGLNNFIDKLKVNQSAQSIVYKGAVGLMALYSARDALLSLTSSNFKLPDAYNNIRQFSGIDSEKPTNISTMRTFNRKNELDAESIAPEVTRLKADEDRRAASAIKDGMSSRMGITTSAEAKPSENPENTLVSLGF